MIEDWSQIPVYEIPARAIRSHWVSDSFLRLLQQRRQVPVRRATAAFAGSLISVLAHLALIGSVVWYGAAQRRALPPDRLGEGAIATSSEQIPVMTLILINESAQVAQPDPSDDQIASRGVKPPKFPLSIAGPDALSAADLRDAAADDQAEPETAEDQSHRALMFGRYTGQIKARIERAWLRPRTAIGAGSFACRVQIVQDRSGNVRETTLQRCNGDARWQVSLVMAIQSASPLPAPPEPTVFTSVLLLEFDATGYVAGARQEGFEPAARVALSDPSAPSGRW